MSSTEVGFPGSGAADLACDSRLAVAGVAFGVTPLPGWLSADARFFCARSTARLAPTFCTFGPILFPARHMTMNISTSNPTVPSFLMNLLPASRSCFTSKDTSDSSCNVLNARTVPMMSLQANCRSMATVSAPAAILVMNVGSGVNHKPT